MNCPHCQGTGEVYLRYPDPQTIIPCPKCGGSGEMEDYLEGVDDAESWYEEMRR